MIFKKKQKGLTLVEVLVALGVSALVGTLLLVIITNSAGIFYKQASKVESGLNINDALVNFRENIKQSSSVAETYTYFSTTYNSGTTQLILKIASIDSSDNIIADTFDYFVYFLDEKKLRLKTFPGVGSSRKAQDRIFSTVVDSLLFEYLNSAFPPVSVNPTVALKVRITLTLKQKSGAGYDTQKVTSEVNLRNN